MLVAAPYLYWLDLNTSFPTESNITAAELGSIAVPPNITPRMQKQLNSGSGSGVFFRGSDSLSVFDGLNKNDVQGGNILAKFNTSSTTWDSESVAGAAVNLATEDQACMPAIKHLGCHSSPAAIRRS